MGTPAAIAKINEDGTLKAIRVNYDGYPDYMGQLLVFNYDESEKIDEMMKLGEFSHLEERLDRSVAYHRDRGEKLRPAVHFSSVEDFSKNGYGKMGVDYLYYFDGSHWNLVDKEDGDYHIELRSDNIEMLDL